MQKGDAVARTPHAHHVAGTGIGVSVFIDAELRQVEAAARIGEQSVTTRAMPIGNLTGMTDAERAALGAWIAGGAQR